MLSDSQIVFLTGVCFFVALFAATLCVGAWYYSKGVRLTQTYNRRNGYHVHWTNTHWIYGVILIDCVLFLWLYSTQYQGQGIAVSLGGQYLLWARWWTMTLVALIDAVALTYVMTYRSHDIQSLVMILMAPLAYVALFCATVSQDGGTRGTALFFSALFYALSALSYVMPLNKWRVTGSRFHSDIDGQPWAAYYHRAFYVLLAVTYVAYVVVWSLCESNELTTVISFDASTVVYLVLDAASRGLFAIYMFTITGTQNLHNLQVVEEEKAAGRRPGVLYKSPARLGANK